MSEKRQPTDRLPSQSYVDRVGKVVKKVRDNFPSRIGLGEAALAGSLFFTAACGAPPARPIEVSPVPTRIVTPGSIESQPIIEEKDKKTVKDAEKAIEEALNPSFRERAGGSRVRGEWSVGEVWKVKDVGDETHSYYPYELGRTPSTSGVNIQYNSDKRAPNSTINSFSVSLGLDFLTPERTANTLSRHPELQPYVVVREVTLPPDNGYQPKPYVGGFIEDPVNFAKKVLNVPEDMVFEAPDKNRHRVGLVTLPTGETVRIVASEHHVFYEKTLPKR